MVCILVGFLWFISSFLFRESNGMNAPRYIHPCTNTTAKCLVPTIQQVLPHFVKGIPEMGVDPMDPFIVEHIENILPGGLVITFDQGYVTGFRKCIVDDARANLRDEKWLVQFHCNLTIRGQYTAKGQLMGFVINSDGDAKIKMTNLRMTVRLKTEYKRFPDNDDDFYIKIKGYKYEYRYGDKIHYNFTGLFPSNKQMSDIVLDTLNANAMAVAEEFGAPLIRLSVDRVMNNIKKFFKAVPYDQIFNVPLPEGAHIVD